MEFCLISDKSQWRFIPLCQRFVPQRERGRWIDNTRYSISTSRRFDSPVSSEKKRLHWSTIHRRRQRGKECRSALRAGAGVSAFRVRENERQSLPALGTKSRVHNTRLRSKSREPPREMLRTYSDSLLKRQKEAAITNTSLRRRCEYDRSIRRVRTRAWHSLVVFC